MCFYSLFLNSTVIFYVFMLYFSNLGQLLVHGQVRVQQHGHRHQAGLSDDPRGHWGRKGLSAQRGCHGVQAEDGKPRGHLLERGSREP